ncbi:transmembrane domain-containing protein [Streptomonospora algeriensis]|uniref:Transmembrane domain-containing protein n=1 Tax=Streptomonospora algeriensis TaxID=995084 RepID=A0ABW3BK29_9ACTN
MSPAISRTASGTAAVCLGLGASLITGPAWADSLEGSSATYSYTCADQVGDLSETLDVDLHVAAPAEGEVGEDIEFQVQPTGYKYYYYVEGGDITSGTLSAGVVLGGGAAPSPSSSASTEAEGAFGPEEPDTFDETALRGAFTPTAPGEVTLAPGDITIDVTQSHGPSTTVCSPDNTTDTLATVNVTGEAIATETPEGDAGEDAGEDADSGGGATSDGTAAAGDDGPPQALLIAGAVVGGLLVILGIGMFGLMFYFMRRS